MKYPKIEQRVIVTLTASVAGKHGETLEAIYHGRNNWEPIDQAHAWFGDACVESWAPTVDVAPYEKILEDNGLRCVGHEFKRDTFGRKQVRLHPHLNDLHVAKEIVFLKVMDALRFYGDVVYDDALNAFIVELKITHDDLLQKPDLSLGPYVRCANKRAHALEAWGDALQTRVQELENELKNRPVILASPYPM